ncbi:hypothetical protein LBMAG21_16960 [Armatimonadota bacterium]|nr:hypothetical protein LBMAG21_16960 [Armatimonadota bacterium]
MSSRFHKLLQLVILSVTFSLLLCGSASASGEEYIWATGKVLDKSGKPVRNAYIAVYDDNNKVIDYANTDQNGDYALAVPRHVMHIDKKGKGFLTQVFGTVTRFVGGATDFVNNPLRAGIKAITSSEAAAVLNPIQKGTISAGGAVADQILLRLKTPSSKPSVQEERKQPGVLLIKVIGENSQDLVGTARVYWMQQETLKAGGRETRTTTAWLDPVTLIPVEAEGASNTHSDYLTIVAGRILPSLAEVGQTVKIAVRIPIPPTPDIYMVVVAKHNRTGQMWELKSVGNDRYEASFEVDKKFPLDDQTISVLAYASDQQKQGRRDDAERAIDRAGLWDIRRPYRFDPLLVVSRNRADLNFTVLRKRKN